ncbi:MAG TPA: hypothetical protein VGB91_14915 [Rhizomicrobium sp.]
MTLSASRSAPVVPAHLPSFGALAEAGTWEEEDFVLRFFPVVDMRRRAVASLFCTPMCDRVGADTIYGHCAFPAFTGRIWSAIDVAILHHALAFAGRLAAGGVAMAVGASVSFATLSDPTGRMIYRAALRLARAQEQIALAIKIEDIPPDTPAKRIGEIASTIAGLAPRVWLHLPDSRAAPGGQGPLHAAGLVLTMPPQLPHQGAQAEARWLARHAAQHGALACMDHVDTQAELESTLSAGVHFVAGAALRRASLSGVASAGEVLEALAAPLAAAGR